MKVPLFFKDGADIWYSQLPAEQHDTLEHLKEAFRGRYNNNDISGYRKTADLWAMRQRVGQSTADFSAESAIQEGSLTGDDLREKLSEMSEQLKNLTRNQTIAANEQPREVVTQQFVVITLVIVTIIILMLGLN